jgi:regulatory protein
MKVTAIKTQITRKGYYSIFIDNKYYLSISEIGLLKSKLSLNQELNEEEVTKLKQLASDDKIYNQTLRFASLRLKTRWEVEEYLKRHKTPPPLATTILNKLSEIGLIDDRKFAETFVNNRRLLRPTSKLKLKNELKKRRINTQLISEVLGDSTDSLERDALKDLIIKKRRQLKYGDDLKLMQYLARQGFNYGDIKTAISELEK